MNPGHPRRLSGGLTLAWRFVFLYPSTLFGQIDLLATPDVVRGIRGRITSRPSQKAKPTPYGASLS
ncbi:hypothetical protein MPC4_20038 [Methylocella tundrae]|uniref:Uncharacterized protein n=1 Tax=Methylocella tundrae TaxID=227605 RepID=A0A8B6M4Q5_METTU|nr:hypothetical protein MPC1_7250002 [Methylocella tundrae]VTZ49828.1 hypothetical protein MPC4_20038 [Methylocella tundrae]